jgi:hypothetical protein
MRGADKTAFRQAIPTPIGKMITRLLLALAGFAIGPRLQRGRRRQNRKTTVGS